MVDRFFPSFSNLEPSVMMKSINRIKESKCYNKNYHYKEPDKDKFSISYNKMKKNEELLSRDFKTLAYYIEYLIKTDDFKNYKEKFYKNIDNMIGIRGLVRPLVSYIYSNNRNYENDIYLMLKVVLRKLEKKKFEAIKESVEKNSLIKFKNKICKEFECLETIDEIDKNLEKFFIKKDDKFYHRIISSFIVKNHRFDGIFQWAKSILNSMDISMKNKILEDIILSYENEPNVERYPENWFLLIKEILGEPYATIGNRWSNLDDRCKEIFRRWFNSKSIHEFFENKVKGGDRRRLEFWKKYIDEIYRIKYIEDANNALLMEFKNHLFIEFAQQSNASYIYRKSVYNIDKIEQKMSTRINCRGQYMVGILKNQMLVERKLTHRAYWEYDFDLYINGLGYESK